MYYINVKQNLFIYKNLTIDNLQVPQPLVSRQNTIIYVFIYVFI